MGRRKFKFKKRKQIFRVAVVGEGITEWYYTNRLNQNEDVNTSVKPSLPQSSNYNSVFKKADRLITDGYDKVICLIDLDVINADKNEVIKYCLRREKIKRKGNIIILETMPCIEYWFLLHFVEYSNRIFSDCDSVVKMLRKHIPEYEKTRKYHESNDIYKILSENGSRGKAVEIACRLYEEMQHSDNRLYPFTEVYLLFEELKK